MVLANTQTSPIWGRRRRQKQEPIWRSYGRTSLLCSILAVVGDQKRDQGHVDQSDVRLAMITRRSPTAAVQTNFTQWNTSWTVDHCTHLSVVKTKVKSASDDALDGASKLIYPFANVAISMRQIHLGWICCKWRCKKMFNSRRNVAIEFKCNFIQTTQNNAQWIISPVVCNSSDLAYLWK